MLSFLEDHPADREELAAELERLRTLGLIDVVPEEERLERVGDFRLVRRIGSGGMGVVHEAEQVSLGRRVAVKLVRPELAFFDQSRERFRLEVEAASRLAHPGIAQVFAVGEESGVPWYAMELVEGTGLDALVRAFEGRDPRTVRGDELTGELERRLGPSTDSSGTNPALFEDAWVDVALRLARQVAESLEHSHGRGVVHRDVKPSNVLVTRTGRAILVDFGLALTERAARITRTNTQPGSLPYMSPEQLAGEHVGARADVYSLGVTLHELLALRPAFAGSIEQVRSDIAAGRCEPLPHALPADVRTVVATAMERDPHRRYATAADLARDLGNLLEHRPIDARTPSLSLRLVRWGQRHPRLATAGLTAVLGGLGVSLFFLQRERDHAVALRGERDVAQLELTRSQLERGSLLARTGALAAAEAILWPQLLESPGSDEALWALRGLYHRFPCLATRHLADDREFEYVARPLLVHPDGQRLLSVAQDGVLRVHHLDALTSDVVGTQEPGWHDLALSEQRGLLFHLGSALDVYRLDSLERHARLEGPGYQGAAIALLPSEDLLMLGGYDGSLRMLELDTWAVLKEIPLFDELVADLSVAPDGRVAALGGRGRLLLLGPPYTEPTLAIDAHPGFASVARFSPGGRLIVTAGRNTIRVWDGSSGEQVHELDVANGNLRMCAFTADGEELLSGGWWALDRWSLKDGSWKRLVGLQTNALTPLESSGLWAASHRSTLRLWLDRGIVGPADFDSLDGPAVVRFDQGGGRLHVSDNAGRGRTWDFEARRPLRDFRPHAQRTCLMLGRASSGLLWTSGADGTARLWRAGSEDPVVEIGEVFAPFSAMGLSNDGSLLAVACRPGRIEVHDASDGALISQFETSGAEIFDVRFSADGQRIASSSRDHRVRVHTIGGAPIASLDFGWGPLALDLHVDGRRMAVSSWGGHVIVHDLETGEQRLLVGHGGSVWDMRFRPGHPDQLLTGSGDGTGRLWDVSTGRSLLFLDEFGGQEVASVDFDPTGRWMALGCSDGRVRLYDLDESLRCVAGNLEHQIELHGGGSDPTRLRQLLDRAASTR